MPETIPDSVGAVYDRAPYFVDFRSAWMKSPDLRGGHVTSWIFPPSFWMFVPHNDAK